MNILIVDDHEDARMILKKSFMAKGHAVNQAVNGREALEKIRNSPPDIIISDILMPVMDGFQLCRAIKSDANLHSIPFIFYTATYTDDRDENFAREIGADHFIRKPQPPDEFIRQIDATVDRLQGRSIAASKILSHNDEETYRLYSERLVQKLERKMLALEQALQAAAAAENKAQQMEVRFSTAFEHANIGICLVSLEGRLMQVNSKMSDIFGYSCRELETMTIHDITHPDDRNVSPEFIKKALSGQIQSDSFKKRYLHKQGHLVWGEVSSSLIKDFTSGSPMYFISHVKDISEQVRAEEALRRSEDKYRTLVESANDAICIFQDGLIKYHTRKAETWLGYSSEELMGMPFDHLIHPDDRAQVLNRHYVRLNGEMPQSSYPFRVLNKSGRVIWVEGNATIVDWEEKPAVLSFLRDVSKRISLQDQLQHAQKMEAIGTLTGGIAHDFNNILSVIIGYTDMILMTLKKHSAIFEDIQEIRNAADRATVLIRQLLTFSRKQDVELVVLDLNKLIGETKKMLIRLLREDICLETEFCPNLWPIKADPGQMGQVLMNLVVNARDAMPKGGRLNIRTKNAHLSENETTQWFDKLAPGDYVTLEICDTGAGIDKKIQAHVFEPFFSTKRRGEGTGLGLSTVYGIVHQHGGGITMNSAPGHGTTFIIALPRFGGTEQLSTIEKKQVAYNIGTETILVVEDDAMVRKIVCKTLEKSGFTVLSAANGDEAIKLALDHDGDLHLLLTDVVMPGMEAHEMIDAIVSNRPKIKVIFMSGYTRRDMADCNVPGRKIDFLKKPILPKMLIKKIRTVLDRQA